MEDEHSDVGCGELVVDVAEAFEDVLFSSDYVVEAAEEEDRFFVRDIPGLPEVVVFGVEVVQDEEQTR